MKCYLLINYLCFWYIHITWLLKWTHIERNIYFLPNWVFNYFPLKNNILSFFFTFMWPCIVTNLFVIKPTRCTNFTNLFCHENLQVSDSSSVHHQEFIYCKLSNGVCQTGSKAVYKPVWHIPLLSVKRINSWWWTDELSDTCRISWQNKFVKLVHLVGFYYKELYYPLFPMPLVCRANRLFYGLLSEPLSHLS